jgi:hypothetical protein
LADVDDAVAAQALCAAGLAAAYAPEVLRASHPPAEIAGRILRRWVAEGAPATARWTDPVPAEGRDLADGPPATAFAEAWRQQVGGTLGYPPRLMLDPAPDTDHLGWVVEQLARDGNASAFVPLPPAPHIPPPWRFPLRIGVLAGPAGHGLHDTVLRAQQGGTTGWRRALLQVVRVGREHVSCDILVVDGGPDVAAAAVRGVRELRSQVVLVVGDPGPDAGRAGVPSIVAATGAWAVGLGATAEPGAWVIEVCRHLTHNFGIDAAFHWARETLSAGVLYARPNIVVGQLLARGARAAAAAVTDALAVAVDVEDRGGLEHLDGGELLAAQVRAPSDLARLQEIVVSGRYQFEGGEATDIDNAMRRTEPLTQYAAARRFLRAEISAADAPGVTLDGFRAGTEHRIRVDVGAFSASRLLPSVPLDTVLPPTPLRLMVVLTEPTLLDTPLAAWLDLPALGASNAVDFTLTTRPDTAAVDARLMVLCDNRVVQTVRLPREVQDAPAVVQRTTTTVETAISPMSANLAERRRFDLALVVDSADRAASTVTAVAGPVTGSIRIGDLNVKATVERIARALRDIVEAPDDYATLDAPAAVELLRFLAIRGEMLHSALVIDTERLQEVLDRSRYVQIVSARRDAYFPFEIVYDLPAPDLDATLCPHAADALAADDLDATCPGPHDGTVVCPLGFWGLNRVIERHAVPPEGVDVGSADFLMTSGPGSYGDRILLGSNLIGASGRVDNVESGSIDRVVGTLRALAATTQVVDWTQWQQALAYDPTLLVLLPHTVFDDPSELYGLEIGVEARLYQNKINKQFAPQSPAIVALLGCETARAGTVEFEFFPSLLRRAGVKVVVATLTEVLGRHAAPVAMAFAQELYAACGDQPGGVGDVMVRLRRRMLARGILAVLALAVYGDADWSITVGGD